ncbi:MAG: hypothetical protein BHW56_03075 [Acetobacter sp. 46_36]|nr:MAG: hypothetical protein BHW56_03075 [Acetobacter sp. 46_36]
MPRGFCAAEEPAEKAAGGTAGASGAEAIGSVPAACAGDGVAAGERTAADNKARVRAKFFITIPPLMFEQSISRQKQKVKLKGEIVATGAGGKAPARV